MSRFDSWDNLPISDQATMLGELRAALNAAAPGHLDSLKQLLHEWCVTGEALADPDARAVLLAPSLNMSELRDAERP